MMFEDAHDIWVLSHLHARRHFALRHWPNLFHGDDNPLPLARARVDRLAAAFGQVWRVASLLRISSVEYNA